ncbi:hypothetical protein [Oceanicella actignis]|uniref:hypothetical protein n=1 Tax=Oceanicella actignis TaxID=1189325 RepID=UPI0011E7A4F5|nr:hypothetical protein [Oceanicella actignis]TYO90512.1 capsular polysaccharide transport system permease protein [Oceanicella actignis]
MTDDTRPPAADDAAPDQAERRAARRARRLARLGRGGQGGPGRKGGAPGGQGADETAGQGGGSGAGSGGGKAGQGAKGPGRGGARGPGAGKGGPLAARGNPARPRRQDGGEGGGLAAGAGSGAPAEAARGRLRGGNVDGPRPLRPTVIIEAGAPETGRRAGLRRRLRAALFWLSFVVMVLLPLGLAGWYLWTQAADQYASETSFAVRSLDQTLPSPMTELLGGAADSTAADSQMLFEYLQSQPLVEIIDRKLDLEKIYNHPDADPLFRLGRGRSIEEKVFYWNLAVTVSYDNASGIIYVQTRAFDPDDAQRVAQAVLDESARLINELSVKARADAVRYALADLADAEARVREARRKLQEFRLSERSVDVTQDIAQAMALISQLRAQRAALQADYDSRKDLLGAESPALAALRRQMASLDEQIRREQERIASADPEAAARERDGGGSLTSAAGAQEQLTVELNFAENMYTSALAAVEAARADARRAQRYLATHIAPTRAQEAEYPDRLMWTIAVAFVSLLVWAITLLIIGSIRDRR